ncbi:spore coat protein U [Stutzerimonas nosocomialis]|uniref:Csu type fimbrial protein n=1 Tax=Stutzerimonas nosocomialis TaxID=1056496 RepID=UPI001109E758|nr:spore coat U domain-containing protein [Stutzerimonas nosocomialis]TLX54478.1 spore coat protein U [Stutzerimonas nosocomialis]
MASIAWRGLAALLLVAQGHAAEAASKTATVGIRAELLPACTVGTAQSGGTTFGTLDFGTHVSLDNVITVVGQAGAGALRVNCLTETPYRVLISAGNSGSTGNRIMTGPGAATLRYNLYRDADFSVLWDDSTGVSGVGNGHDQWIPVYGRLPAQGISQPGLYSDTLTVTVSW